MIKQLKKPFNQRSFSPRQWFSGQGTPRGNTDEEYYTEDRVMWVYKQNKTTGKWEVGFYSPQGEWMMDEVFDLKQAAAGRVRWLNGGREEAPSDLSADTVVVKKSDIKDIVDAARRGFHGT